MPLRKLTALVVGVSNYPAPFNLKNAANDANDISASLETLGFTVLKLIDPSNEALDRGLSSFKEGLNSNDIGLFYFAGHGLQIEGENYLAPIDINTSDEISAKHSTFPLNRLLEVMNGCSNNTNIVILDCCRNNPFGRAWTRNLASQELAPVNAPKGTLIAFSTSPGQTASDGKNNNGSYTEALLKHINVSDISIEDVFKRTRNTLSISTNHKQTSWEHTSLTGDFFFNISPSRLIVNYSSNAIADKYFTLNTTNKIHSIIRDLKSHNWYTQNPAINKINAQEVNASDDDSLFVLGRNIYQSAVGSANDATAYIIDFHNKTSHFNKEKRTAILDGILFEIFFDSEGKLRSDFKMLYFNAVMRLQRYEDYADSFEFISDILYQYQNRFYIIPGKLRDVTVDVLTTENSNKEFIINGIYYDGFNILKATDSAEDDEDGDIYRYPINVSQLEELISSEMVIPLDRITFNYTNPVTQKLLFPYMHTLKK